MRRMPKQMVQAEVCGSCIHYRQHYVLMAGACFKPLWYGHCRYPRPKYPDPDKTCPHWQGYEEEPDSQG